MNHATPGTLCLVNWLQTQLQGKVLLWSTMADTSWVIAESGKGEAVWPSYHRLQHSFWCRPTQASLQKAPVLWHKGPMPGLEMSRRLPEEQIPKGSSGQWIRSSCHHIWSATGQCTGTNPLLGFHQWHVRAFELEVPRWNPMLIVINSNKTSMAYMNGKHLGNILHPPKVPNNAYQQKKETHTQRLYH